jgi:hypothetical protein
MAITESNGGGGVEIRIDWTRSEHTPVRDNRWAERNGPG